MKEGDNKADVPCCKFEVHSRFLVLSLLLTLSQVSQMRFTCCTPDKIGLGLGLIESLGKTDSNTLGKADSNIMKKHNI